MVSPDGHISFQNMSEHTRQSASTTEGDDHENKVLSVNSAEEAFHILQLKDHGVYKIFFDGYAAPRNYIKLLGRANF